MAFVTLAVASRAVAVTPLMRDEFMVVAAKTAAKLPATVTASDLTEVPVVLFEPGSNTRLQIESWLLAAGVRLRPAMELGSIEAIKEMVEAGLGCSLLPSMALRAADRKRFQVRPLSPALTRELGMVVRHDKPLTRGMQVFMAAISRLQT